ncbi:hypothetical protein VD659_16160 [Herbiconiux sp. 11R-BC]|uniref:hypothetical protein n=1 Tax=Herbiconiux sp. 11R-BC TaxID=3111637 RepID=UPI003C08BD9F
MTKSNPDPKPTPDPEPLIGVVMPPRPSPKGQPARDLLAEADAFLDQSVKVGGKWKKLRDFTAEDCEAKARELRLEANAELMAADLFQTAANSRA